MTQKIEGTVTFVAKTLGIKLDITGSDTWLNPKGTVKNAKYIHKGIEGKKVELTMENPTTFTFLKILGDGDPVEQKYPQSSSDKSNVSGTKDNYWKQKEEREVENYPRYLMERSISAACNLYNVDLNTLDDDNIHKTVQTVKETAKEFYEQIITCKGPKVTTVKPNKTE